MENQPVSSSIVSQQTVLGGDNEVVVGNRNIVNKGDENQFVIGNNNKIIRGDCSYNININIDNVEKRSSPVGSTVVTLLSLLFACTTGALGMYFILSIAEGQENNWEEEAQSQDESDFSSNSKIDLQIDWGKELKPNLNDDRYTSTEWEEKLTPTTDNNDNSNINWEEEFTGEAGNLSPEESLDRALNFEPLFMDADDFLADWEAEIERNYDLGLMYDRDLEKQRMRQFGQFDILGRESLLLETLFLDFHSPQVQINSLQYHNQWTANTGDYNLYFLGHRFEGDRLDRVEKNISIFDPIPKPSFAFLPPSVDRSNTEWLSTGLDPSIDKIGDGDVISIKFDAGVNLLDRRFKEPYDGAIGVKLQPLHSIDVPEPSIVFGLLSSIAIGFWTLKQKRSR